MRQEITGSHTFLRGHGNKSKQNTSSAIPLCITRYYFNMVIAVYHGIAIFSCATHIYEDIICDYCNVLLSHIGNYSFYDYYFHQTATISIISWYYTWRFSCRRTLIIQIFYFFLQAFKSLQRVKFFTIIITKHAFSYSYFNMELFCAVLRYIVILFRTSGLWVLIVFNVYMSGVYIIIYMFYTYCVF